MVLRNWWTYAESASGGKCSCSGWRRIKRNSTQLMPTPLRPAHKILYVGQVGSTGTCRDRMLALRDLGFAVRAFDTTPYLTAGPRVARSIAHRINVGPRIRRLNADLQTVDSSNGSFSLIWIDKGRWVYPQTLTTLRTRCGGLLVHFTPDPQLYLHKSRHFRACVPVYDVLVTTKAFEVEEYRCAGARRLVLTGQAYDERRASQAQCRAEFDSDVCFIGHREKHYGEVLSHLAGKVRIRLKVWGPRWPRAGRDFVQGAGLWGRDYYDGLASARLGLGLLSKQIPETSTTRTFEIPACGTLLLAERTCEHARYFSEGTEAEFFSSLDELEDKLRFYITNDTPRRRIAEAGRQRCVQAGYGNRARLERLLREFETVREFADLRFSV